MCGHGLAPLFPDAQKQKLAIEACLTALFISCGFLRTLVQHALLYHAPDHSQAGQLAE
jgi:hypothetical protein